MLTMSKPRKPKTVHCHDCNKRVLNRRCKKRGMVWLCRLHYLERELEAERQSYPSSYQK